MGSFSSHHSSSSDGLNSGDKGRKSKRLMSKLRSRQSSRSDLIVTHAIDLNKLRFAQTLPDEGETHSQDHHSTTSADVGECKQKKKNHAVLRMMMEQFCNLSLFTLFFFSVFHLVLDQILVALRDEEESAKNNNNAKAATPSHQQQKPVFDEDRQITFGSATHTGEQVETESTKHNADKAVSCNSAVTVETSRKENFQPAPRESSDKSEAIDGDDNIRICIETESWRTAKNWNCDTSSAAIRTDQGNYRVAVSRSSILLSSPLMFYIRVQSVRVLLAISKIMVQKPVYELLRARPPFVYFFLFCSALNRSNALN